MKIKFSRVLSCLLIATFCITYISSVAFAAPRDKHNIGYTTRYLEEGTEKELAAEDSGFGMVGDSVPADAKDIDGYTLVSETSQTITLQQNENDNVIIFYYRVKTYNVYYDGNGNTAGEAPTDSIDYYSGDIAVVLGDNGMTKNVNGVNGIFLGWSLTKLDDLTLNNYLEYLDLIIWKDTEITVYSDVTLYAVWLFTSLPDR